MALSLVLALTFKEQIVLMWKVDTHLQDLRTYTINVKKLTLAFPPISTKLRVTFRECTSQVGTSSQYL